MLQVPFFTRGTEPLFVNWIPVRPDPEGDCIDCAKTISAPPPQRDPGMPGLRCPALVTQQLNGGTV